MPGAEAAAAREQRVAAKAAKSKARKVAAAAAKAKAEAKAAAAQDGQLDGDANGKPDGESAEDTIQILKAEGLGGGLPPPPGGGLPPPPGGGLPPPRGKPPPSRGPAPPQRTPLKLAPRGGEGDASPSGLDQVDQQVEVPPWLAAAPQLGSCASSGRAWRLWAARHSQQGAGPLGAPPLPRLLELAARLRSRRLHRLLTIQGLPPGGGLPPPGSSRMSAAKRSDRGL